MAENGIVNSVGVSKRSVTAVTAMGALMKLSTSEGNVWLIGGAMVAITALAVGYMIMDEVKGRRMRKGGAE